MFFFLYRNHWLPTFPYPLKTINITTLESCSAKKSVSVNFVITTSASRFTASSRAEGQLLVGAAASPPASSLAK